MTIFVQQIKKTARRYKNKLGKNTPEITKDSRNPSIVKINGARRDYLY